MTVTETLIELQKSLNDAHMALFNAQRLFYQLRELVEELDPEGEK